MFLLIVSGITASFVLAGWSRLKVATYETQRFQLDLLSEGLSSVLAARLSGEGADLNLALSLEPSTCKAGNLTIEARIQGHSGLIDLNAADQTLLAMGFGSLELDKQRAGELAIAVEYFRSGASIYAATAGAKVEITGGYKFALFESVSELQDFQGLNTVPLQELYRTFTVYSHNGALAVAAATPKLAALAVQYRPELASMRGAKTAPERAFTIEVAATRQGSPVVGSAGYIYESVFLEKGLRRAATYPVPDPEEFGRSTVSSRRSCAELFGASIAHLLERWR
ncbi:hypothetical protein [Mesorhizobium sp. 1M-11]|uniref:hypothetical protein n=1 Tax=Mesorhizobium sp. 1M-11 TaxID=1529006 RepID=UPI0006C759B6|nr:hypothetical protein [Mesorhizobium sp. 1M-11]